MADAHSLTILLLFIALHGANSALNMIALLAAATTRPVPLLYHQQRALCTDPSDMCVCCDCLCFVYSISRSINSSAYSSNSSSRSSSSSSRRG
jgi:hypothetical protein